MGDISPAFSPDGRTLAFDRLHAASGAIFTLEGDVYVQDIAGDVAAKIAPRRLTFDNEQVAGLDWAADGRSIIFSSNRSGSLRLWRIGLEGAPTSLEAPGENAVFPSISRKGGWLAYRHDPVVKEGVTLRSWIHFSVEAFRPCEEPPSHAVLPVLARRHQPAILARWSKSRFLIPSVWRR
jgi:Tol biopolymer transport system component